jgi:hypothetical protein
MAAETSICSTGTRGASMTCDSGKLTEPVGMKDFTPITTSTRTDYYWRQHKSGTRTRSEGE